MTTNISNIDLRSDLQKFIVDYNIVGTMAGVAIALYTKDLILSFSGDIIIPLIFIILAKLNIGWITKMLPLPKNVKFDFTAFSRNFISWFLGVIITYIFIQITVKYILGIKSSDDSKKDVSKEEPTKK
jgi:large-conductance mechanosensitive channel